MTRPKLQQLLVWVDRVSDPNPGDFQPVGKRAIAYANAYTYANTNIYTNSYGTAHSYVNANAYAYGIANTNGIACRLANSYTIAIANSIVNAYSKVYIYDKVYSDAIKHFIKYAQWSIKFGVYHRLDLQSTINQLKKLQDQIPSDQQPKEKRHAFGRQLISIFLAAFHLTPEIVDLSKAEIEAMNNYLYATRLLIECDRAAVLRTSAVWKQIEERMLRPVALTP